jgi:hypothetical protein
VAARLDHPWPYHHDLLVRHLKPMGVSVKAPASIVRPEHPQAWITLAAPIAWQRERRLRPATRARGEEIVRDRRRASSRRLLGTTPRRWPVATREPMHSATTRTLFRPFTSDRAVLAHDGVELNAAVRPSRIPADRRANTRHSAG